MNSMGAMTHKKSVVTAGSVWEHIIQYDIL